MAPRLLLLALLAAARAARLVRRDLADHPAARCNDGSVAAYFHEQEPGARASKVLLYLPDGADCATTAECQARCLGSALCTAPGQQVLEREGGIWSADPATNPYHDYFKVYIHYCSSDAFSGTRGPAPGTGGLTFHGKHILAAALQDLAATFGLEGVEQLVLAGSGSGARGVGYNCDSVAEAVGELSPTAEVRCVADAPDLVPWWVRTEGCGAAGRRQAEEAALWGRRGDASCEESQAGANATERALRCGLWSHYWSHVRTPVFLIGSQQDPAHLGAAACLPASDAPERPEYEAAWRSGMVALYESVVAAVPGTGAFLPSCSSHGLLAGGPLEAYWGLQVPRIEGNRTAGLRGLLEDWHRGAPAHALDPAGSRNPGCAAPAPQLGRVGSGLAPALGPLAARRLARRLLAPAAIFPSGYSRLCSLGTAGCGARRPAGLLPEGAVPAYTRRGRLWRRFYYLQYLKLLYNKYKAEYQREYRAYQHVRSARPLLAADYTDYTDYSDYGQDYGGGLLARIVKAVRGDKGPLAGAGGAGSLGPGSVQSEFDFTRDLLDSLPALEDIDFEDFESQVEVISARAQ